MKNFPFEHEGKTLWYSRSVATSGFIFATDEDGELNVLITKRNSKNLVAPNMWSVPGGFLDFDEDLLDCVSREVCEETGLIISKRLFNFWNINSKPIQDNRQTVSIMYYVILPGFKENYDIFPQEEELSEVMWVPISMIMANNFDMAFNNKEIILDMYNKLFCKNFS